MRSTPRNDLLSRLSLALVAMLVCLAYGTFAFAGDVEVARKKFANGIKLYQQGDYEGARRLFKEAEAEHHAAPIVYNLALAEEKLGHLQAALDAYEAYVGEVGDKGDLAPAAAIAIGQIRSRSTRLKIETQPSGAHVFVDGQPLADVSPVTFLVGAGTHVVVAQRDGGRGEQDVVAKGAGDTVPVVIAIPISEKVTPPPPPPVDPIKPPPPDKITPPPPPPPPPSEPEGLVWGVSFAIVPAYLLGVKQLTQEELAVPGTQPRDNTSPRASIVAGPVLEIGYALTERFEFLARGFAGIGPDGKPAYCYMGGPGLSFKIGDRLWVGATFIGGQLELSKHRPHYGTDLVFGAMAEVNFAVLKKKDGEWIAGLQPAFLLTEMRNDNTTFFFPLSFGYRAY